MEPPVATVVPLDSRQARIARHLLERDDPTSVEEIAASLRLTPRMIRYALPSVGAFLEPAGLHVVARRGVGVWVDGDPARRLASLQAVDASSGPAVLDAEDRKLRALAALLDAAPAALHLADLEIGFGVSRPTVRRDIRAAERWLEQHHLHVSRLPGVGVMVRGTEIDVRKALVAVVLEGVTPADLLTQAGVADPGDSTHAPTGGLETLLAELDLPTYRAVLAEHLPDLDDRDPMLLTAAVFVAIVARRVRAGQAARLEAGQLRSLLDHPVADAAARIATSIEAVDSLTLGEGDVASITEFLLGFAALTDLPIVPEAGDEGLIDRLITAAAGRLHPLLAQDDQLRRSLVEHVRRLRLRLQYGLPISNPLQHEVRERYPDVYAVASEILAELGPVGDVVVPGEEVGFLTMYLAGSLERNRLRPKARITVVCPAGMATAWILVSRLLAEFPQAEVARVVSKTVFEAEANDDLVDVVVSTVPLESGLPGVPTIVVSPLLRSRDVRRLSRILGEPSR